MRRFSRRAILRAGALCAVGAALGPHIPTTARETSEIPLVEGWNSATWCGPDTPIADAVGSLPLIAAYGWDVPKQRWLAYAQNTAINSIGTLRHGQPLRLRLKSDAVWRQPSYRGPLPELVELPVGWSYLGWSGLRETVWTTFGEDPYGPVAEVWRWNTDYAQWYSYVPGESAQQLFAVLHPGNAVWVKMRVGSARWNPAGGIVQADLASRVVPGEITYYHPSLAGGVMYCPPHSRYDPQDVTVGAAVTWPCGTRLRIWRDERFVDVIVQDTGLLGHNHVDLSEAAFQRLATLPEGRVRVLIEVLAGPD
ncbi:MAG: hypothetical protein F4Z51_03290 [Chloroflexi bacterium]|nr:hypothetical protein [Chloroflexota bacterium]MYD17456.1 hypothetical protein [Chloroflexota bacterium]MYJ01984.1 hypothetical protein [Chloroflexota bacterium]